MYQCYLYTLPLQTGGLEDKFHCKNNFNLHRIIFMTSVYSLDYITCNILSFDAVLINYVSVPKKRLIPLILPLPPILLPLATVMIFCWWEYAPYI
jgi:hypothetical protein